MTRRQLFLYALPAFALGMPTIPVYVFLPSFYAEEIGIGLTVIGGILLFARITDVVTDPLVGLLSDKLKTRWGRRKPWMIGGAVAAAASLLMLFTPPADAGAVYLLVGAVLLYLGWTAVAIPYSAWGAELSPDYGVRSQITGAREGLQILGVLVAASIPALAALFQASRTEGLAAIAWLAIVVGIPAFWFNLTRISEPKTIPEKTQTTFRLGELSSALRNRPFLRLLCAWFANGIANGIPAALFPLYLGHVLKADGVAQGILVFAYFLCGVLAIPAWLAVSHRLGKHRAWCAAMIMACAAFVWVPWIPEGGFVPFLIVCVVTGAALGADLALPLAMQADVIDFDTLRTGQARAGLFFALWSMGTKLALAIAVGLAFPCLELLGFDAQGENTAEALLALAVIYALIPIVFKLCAVGLVWRHPIDKRRHQAIIRRLRARDGRHVSNGEAGALTP